MRYFAGSVGGRVVVARDRGLVLAVALLGLGDEEEALLVAAVGLGLEADDRVQGDGDVGRLLAGEAHEVGVEEAEDALVRDDEERLAVALHLVDHRVEAVDHVEVRLAARVAVGELVVLAPLELLGVVLLDLRVGHAVADAREDLVQVRPRDGPELDPLLRVADVVALVVDVRLPVGDVGRGLARAPHGRRPEARGPLGPVGRLRDLRDAELRELLRVGVARGREAAVAADLAEHVVLRLAVAAEVEDVGLHVEVAEELDEAAGHVAPDVVDDEAAAVDDLDPAPVALGAVEAVRVDGLVVGLVLGDAPPEVLDGVALGHAHVVRRAELAGDDVALDDVAVRADGLEEDDLAVELAQPVVGVVALGQRRVGPVEDGDAAVVLLREPRAQVAERRVRRELALARARLVLRVEPLRRVVVPEELAPVVADVEEPHVDRVEELEVAVHLARDERLAARGQAHEDEHDLVRGRAVLALVRRHVEQHGVVARRRRAGRQLRHGVRHREAPRELRHGAVLLLFCVARCAHALGFFCCCCVV